MNEAHLNFHTFKWAFFTPTNTSSNFMTTTLLSRHITYFNATILS